MFCNQLGCCKRIVIFHRENGIINIGVQCFWNKSSSNSLNLVWTRLPACQYLRIKRFYSDYLHGRILGLQIGTCSADRSASSNSCNEKIYLTICILPDFWAGCFAVSFWICWVFKLTWNETVRNFFCQFLCTFNRTFHSLYARCQNNFCSISF